MTHRPLILLLVAGIVLPTGCQNSRLFSPLAKRSGSDAAGPSMHGPSTLDPNMQGHSTRGLSAQGLSDRGHSTHGSSTRGQNAPDVRVTNDASEPETMIEPVAQRLATTRQVSHVSENAPASTSAEPVADGSPQSIPDQDQESSGTLQLPEGYSGIDISELMKALKDAPPKVQQAAVARLIAMSRDRAKPTSLPSSIEQQLAASLDSLPELPDEVIDHGVHPSRIAATQSKPQPTGMPIEAPLATQQTIELAANTTHQQPAPSAQQATPATGQPEASTVSSVAATKPAMSFDANVAQANLEQTSDQGLTAQSIQPVSMSMSDDSDSISEAGSMSGPESPQSKVDSSDLTDAELFDALVERLHTESEDESESERHRRLIMARHLMVLSGDPDRAVDKLDGLSREEQEYLRHQLMGLWTMIDPNGHPVPSRRLTTALPEIRKATDFLSAATDSLEVRGLEFCTEIEAYGQVKPFPSRRFDGGQEVILYCEIDNFISDPVEGGFETLLQGSYDVLDSSGRRVTSQTLPESQQVSKNRLRDYYIAYQMYLPESLDVGRYQLRLTMEDVHGKKYGQAKLDFEIKK